MLYADDRTSSYTSGGMSSTMPTFLFFNQRIRNVWCSFRKYTLEPYDRPSIPFELKICMLGAEVLEAMLYSCVTWSPPQLTDSLNWLATKHHSDHPIFHLDTLVKTRSIFEAIVRKRRILFAGFVACMEDTRLTKCVMLGELSGGVGCVGGKEKECMGCFLDDLRAFGINADQWRTAAQDEGKWCISAEQGAERLMAKWIATEKLGLDYGMQ